MVTTWELLTVYIQLALRRDAFWLSCLQSHQIAFRTQSRHELRLLISLWQADLFLLFWLMTVGINWLSGTAYAVDVVSIYTLA